MGCAAGRPSTTTASCSGRLGESSAGRTKETSASSCASAWKAARRRSVRRLERTRTRIAPDGITARSERRRAPSCRPAPDPRALARPSVAKRPGRAPGGVVQLDARRRRGGRGAGPRSATPSPLRSSARRARSRSTSGARSSFGSRTPTEAASPSRCTSEWSTARARSGLVRLQRVRRPFEDRPVEGEDGLRGLLRAPRGERRREGLLEPRDLAEEGRALRARRSRLSAGSRGRVGGRRAAAPPVSPRASARRRRATRAASACPRETAPRRRAGAR